MNVLDSWFVLVCTQPGNSYLSKHHAYAFFAHFWSLAGGGKEEFGTYAFVIEIFDDDHEIWHRWISFLWTCPLLGHLSFQVLRFLP